MQDVPLIFSLAILVISVVIHEVSHGSVANLLGDPTARLEGRLTLNPLKHVDFVGSFIVPLVTFFTTAGHFVFGWAKPVPYNPYNLRGGKWGPAIVAAAGPLSNLFVAIFFGFGVRALDLAGVYLPIQAGPIIGAIIGTNILLAVFNLVPIPPLDGSKVLFALLPYNARVVQEFLEKNQYFILFIFVFFLSNYLSPIIDFIFRLIVGA